MNFYRYNLEKLKDISSEFVEKIKNEEGQTTLNEIEVDGEKIEVEKYEIIEKKTNEGRTVFLGKTDIGIYQLNSNYEEEDLEEKWLEQFENMPDDGIVFFFGMVRTEYLNRFAKEYPDVIMFIYEPSKKIFERKMEESPFDFIKEKTLLVVNGINQDHLEDCIKATVHYDLMPKSRWINMPNYKNVFKTEYKWYLKLMRERGNDTTIDRNTYMRFQDNLVVNLRENLRYVMRSYDLYSLKEKFPKGKPGIVVSAGPSLNKNIDMLKKAKDKAFIIATDTALKPLINHGIIPDIGVTIDPSKPMILFDKEEIKDIPMALAAGANYQLLEQQRGKVFFMIYPSDSYIKYYERYEKETLSVETGGSVANNAFSLGVEFGCNPMILIGQDLAFTGNVGYADGTFKDKMGEEDTTAARFVDVEGINGETLRTSKDFYHYLKWFEKEIESFEGEIEVVDATEGGALIRGTKVMTLEDAIDKYCSEELNLTEVIDEAPRTFTRDEIAEVDEFLINVPDTLKKMRKKLKEGINKYEEAEFYVKRDEYGRKLKDLVKELGKLTDYLDEAEVMDFIHPYLFTDEYLMRRKVADNRMENGDDIRKMMREGKVHLEKVAETIDKFESDFVAMSERVKAMQEKEKEEEKR